MHCSAGQPVSTKSLIPAIARNQTAKLTGAAATSAASNALVDEFKAARSWETSESATMSASNDGFLAMIAVSASTMVGTKACTEEKTESASDSEMGKGTACEQG